MRKIYKTLIFMLAACLFPAIRPAATRSTIADGSSNSEPSFDGNAYLKTLREEYTIKDEILTEEKLKDGDLVVWGTSHNNVINYYDYTGAGFYLDAPNEYSTFLIFKIHMDSFESEKPSGEPRFFNIEVLNPYEYDEYQPHYLNIEYDEYYGDYYIDLTEDPDPTKSKTNFVYDAGYIKDKRCVSSAHTDVEIVYQEYTGPYNYPEAIPVVGNDFTFNCKKNNLGFFAFEPAAKITYNPNGASGEVYTKVTKWHDKIDTNTFVYDKKCFKGWSTDPTGRDGFSYTEGQEVTLNTGITLYAQWEDNPLYEIEDMEPQFSLAYKYTHNSIKNEFVELTDINDLVDSDSMIIVAEYEGETYAMNHEFIGEKVIISDGKITHADNKNYDNWDFYVERHFMGADSLALSYNGSHLNDAYNDRRLVYGGSIGDVFDFATINGSGYLVNDVETRGYIVMAKYNEGQLRFYFTYAESLGQEGYSSAGKIFYRRNNPYSDVDFRVRIGIDIYDYANKVQSFNNPTFDISKFTSYGIDVRISYGRDYTHAEMSYDFLTSQYAHRNETGEIEYVILGFGDCLTPDGRERIDYKITATPFVVYDGEKIKSNKPKTYSIRDMVSVYYNYLETQEAVADLYNIFSTIDEYNGREF